MKLKAIIVDDEAGARETLAELIKDYPQEVEIVAKANTVNTGLEAILRNEPDVVFLDIRLSPGTGFDILEKLPKINFEIIFTTAYDRYALKAFKFSALDYLLKPISAEDLFLSLDKVIRRRERLAPGSQENIRVFKENLQTKDVFNKIALPTSDGLLVINTKDIIRCEGIKSYTSVFLTNKDQIVVSRKLKEFEEMLGGQGFIRIFQSHLINIDHIKRYIKGRGGEVEMSDNTFLPVSRDKKGELLDKLHSLK